MYHMYSYYPFSMHIPIVFHENCTVNPIRCNTSKCGKTLGVSENGDTSNIAVLIDVFHWEYNHQVSSLGVPYFQTSNPLVHTTVMEYPEFFMAYAWVHIIGLVYRVDYIFH